jgi:hypothetical protein
VRRRGQGSGWIRAWRRLQLYALDSWRCVYCTRSAWVDGVALTLDHLVPQCLGGSTANTNLITCCWQCNTARHTLPVHDFVAALADERRECVTAIQGRIRAALRRRDPQANARQLAGVKARAKVWASTRPAWLVAYRKRASNRARADGVDAERQARRDAEAERWAQYDDEQADDEGPPPWTDEDMALHGIVADDDTDPADSMALEAPPQRTTDHDRSDRHATA